MSEPAIKVEGLSKRYRIGVEEDQHDTLFGALSSWVKSPIENYRRVKRLSSFGDDEADDIIWALKDVSFEVERGEVVGVIGRNGAGKSTLLKILSHITEPTSGYAKIRGRVSSLLEVGTGFHDELTGRENVYLNGTILGMSKTEVDRKFDEIVAFSGVEKFIDTPVKRYSSGMKVRLAFAVAAHLEPEILLVDEVLAVGDVGFQKKCLSKMEDVTDEGRTVLFISHNMGMVRSLCERTILLKDGQVALDGPTDESINQYLATDMREAIEGEIRWDSDAEAPGEEVALRQIQLLGPDGVSRDTFDAAHPIGVEITYRVHEPVRGMRLILQLKTQEGVVAFSSTDHKERDITTLMPGMYTARCLIPGGLLNQRKYLVRIHAGIPGVKVLIPGREFLSFVVEGSGTHGSHFEENWPGVVAPELSWEVDELVESM